jgi:hypothetical protein
VPEEVEEGRLVRQRGARTTGRTGCSGCFRRRRNQRQQRLPGTNATATVKQLEDKVTELLTKLKSLETVLSGINNQQLKEAIASVPVVDALCTQAKALNEQSTGLGTALSGLSAVVDTLTLMGLPTVPAALPAFECP